MAQLQLHFTEDGHQNLQPTLEVLQMLVCKSFLLLEKKKLP